MDAVAVQTKSVSFAYFVILPSICILYVCTHTHSLQAKLQECHLCYIKGRMQRLLPVKADIWIQG